MKATIKSERLYTITIVHEDGYAATHEGCIKEDDWNGLTAFRAKDGSKIIVKCNNELSDILPKIFDRETSVTGDIVMISPSLIPSGL